VVVTAQQRGAMDAHHDHGYPRLSYKINEAAKILGVSPITIRRAISRGLLKPCRAFRHPLIPAEQLKKLIEPGEG